MRVKNLQVEQITKGKLKEVGREEEMVLGLVIIGNWWGNHWHHVPTHPDCMYDKSDQKQKMCLSAGLHPAPAKQIHRV